MPLDYNQFAEKIKQKYPEYKDIDNYTLATKMVEKYPEYQTQVSLKKKEESQSTLVQDNTSSDRLNKTTTKPTVSSSLKGEGIYTIQGQPEGTFYKKVGNDWYKKQYKVFDYTKVTDPNRIKQIESNTIEYKPKPKEDLYILPSNPDALYKKSGGKWMKKVGKNYVYLTGDKVSEREAILNKQAKKASQFDLDRMANYAPDVVQQEEAKPIENKELKKSFEEKYGDIKVLEKEMELKRQEELKKQAPAEKEYFNWRIGAGKIFDFDDPASVEAYGNISPSFYMDFYDSHGNPISTMNAENMKIAEQNMKKDFGEAEFKAFHSIADIPSREKLASLGEGNAAKLLNEKFKGTNIHFYQDGSEIRIVSSLYNGIDNTILNEKTFDLNYSGADKYIRSFTASNLLKKSEKEKFDKVSSLDDLVEIVGTNPYKFPASLLEDIDVDSYYSKKRKMLEGELNRSKADTYQQDSKKFDSEVQSFNNQIKSGSMTQQEFDKKSAELETKRKELESRRRLISNAVNEAERIDKITNNLYKANVIDSQKKEQEGSFLGIIGRQFGQGLTNVSKTALDFTAAAGSLFTDAKTFANTISPGSYENLKNLGYTDEEIKNETQKTIKSAGNKILEDVPDVFGAGTTKEYVQSKDRGQIEQAIGSLAESLGTMAGGIATTPGLSTGVTPAFFAMSYNAMEDQMRGPAFDALSENEKKIISLPYGLIIGQLEKFGAKVGMNAAKNPTINAFSQYILGKTFSSIPKNASLLEVKSAIDKSVAASIASGMIKITGAGVVEGGTEFTQQIFEGIEKDVANRIIQSNQLSAAGEKYDGKIPDQIVNQIKENKFFKDAGDLTTYEGISNLFSQSVDAFNIGFLAGGMGGTVDVAIKDPIENKVSNNRFKIYKDVVTNDRAREGFISAINKKVDDGELTRMEADDQIKSVNESYSTMMKIPNDLSTSAQKEAFSLMSERNQLEKEITGKDPSLVAKQKDRVAEIDEQLKGLSYAVQERSTEEVLPRESEAVGETGGQREGMGQGVQGEIVAEEGPITQEEKVTPKAEIGGIIRGYESISEQDNVGDVRSELPNQNQGTVIVEGKDGNQYAVAFSRKGADGKNIFEQGTTTPRPGYISASVKIDENATPEQIQAAQQEAQRNLDIILPTVVDGAINPQAINEIMAQQAPVVAPVIEPSGETGQLPATAQINVAPLFNTKVTNIQEAEAIRQSDVYKQYKQKIETTANDFGVTVNNIDDSIGGYAGVSEVSNVVNVTGDWNNVVEFAAVFGAMTPEVQDSTIAGRAVEANTEEHNADRFDIGINNQEAAMKAASDAGFDQDGFTLSGDKISFFNIFEYPVEDFENKYVTFVDKYLEYGGQITSETKSAIQSEFIDSDRRAEIIAAIEGNAVQQAGRQGVRNAIQEAKPRNEEYIRRKTPQVETEQQPVAETSNENELTDRNVRTMSVKYKRNPIVKAATNVLKALPGVKIYLHENTDQYSEALANKTGENKQSIQSEESAGSYIDGEIHLDMSQANTVTLLHEAVHHALMVNGVKGNYIIDMANGLRDIIKDKNRLAELDAFIKQYKGETDQETLETRSDEFVAQLGGILAANQEELTTTGLTKFKALINRLFKKLGFGNVFTAASTSQDAVNFINTITRGLNVGENINNIGINGVFDTKNAKRKKSILATGLFERYPDNPNTKVEENVPLSRFNGKRSNVFESDRMTGAYIADDKGNKVFNFFGGIFFPRITGKWWASSSLSTATSIANNSKRDADGYIYGTPIIMSPGSQMSNNDMLLATLEFMKMDVMRKNSGVSKPELMTYIEKAFEKKKIIGKKNILKNALKRTNNIEQIFDELEYVLFQEDPYIKDRSGNYILTDTRDRISKLTFEERKEIVSGILGDPKVMGSKFPSAGSMSQMSEKFTEPETLKSDKLWDIVVVYRTKGNLIAKAASKSDEFYHKSYPYEILAVDENGNPAEIEVFMLDGAYNLTEAIPEMTKSSGDVFTWAEHEEAIKSGKYKSEAVALNQYGRTSKLSRGSGEISARKKQLIQRTDQASEKLQQLFQRDNMPLTTQEAKEIVGEVIDWTTWYDGLSTYVDGIFGEYAEDVLSLLPLASMAANSVTTVSLAISNAERIYQGEMPKGVAEYYGYISDFLQGKGIKSDKMSNFYKALTGDKDAIAVDSHVWSIIMWKNPNKKQVNPKNQAEFEKAKEFVRTISDELGLAPREVQAALWAANILRTGERPDSYEEYFKKQLDAKGLKQRIETWRDKGYKPFSEIRKEREAAQTTGRKKQLVAPNGKPSNLNEKQWNQVRTPEFKKWFGDWENDPENASKVVDENGEPLVVYHGSRTSFEEFDSGVKKIHFRPTALDGFWFTSNKNNAQLFGENLIELFLNIKNPIDFDVQDMQSIKNVVDGFMDMNYFNYKKGLIKNSDLTQSLKNRIYKNNNDGVIYRNMKDMILADNFQVFEPNQIKSATENVGTFSAETPKIKFQKAPKILGQKPTKVIVNDEAKALIGQIKLEIRAQREQKKAQTEVRKSISDNVKAMVKKGSINLKQASTIISTLNRVNLDNPEMVKRFNDYIAKVFDKAEYIDKVERATRMKKKIKQNLKGASNPFAIAAKGFSQLEPKWVENIDDYIAVAQAVYDSVRKSTVRKGVINWKQEADFQEIAQYVFDEEARQTEVLLGNLRNLYERITGKSSDGVGADVMQAELKDMSTPEDFSADVIDQIEERLAEFEQMVEDTDPEVVQKAASIDPTIIPAKEAIRILDALDTYFTNGSIAGLNELIEIYTGKENAIKFKYKAKPLRALGSKKLAQTKFQSITQFNMILERKFRTKEAALAYKKASGIQDIENGSNKAEKQAMTKQREYVSKFGKVKGFNSAENVFQRGALANLLRTMVASEEMQQAEFDRNIEILRNSVDTLSKGNSNDQKKAKVYKEVLTKLGVFNPDVNLEMVLKNAKKENIDAVNFVIDMFGEIVDPLSDLALGMYNQILTQDINYTPYVYKMTDLKGNYGSKDYGGTDKNGNPNLSFFGTSTYANQTFDKNKAGVLMPITRPKDLRAGMHVDLDFDNNMFRQYRNALVDLYTAGPIRRLDGFFNSEQNEKILNSNEDQEIIYSALVDYIRTKKGSSFVTDDGLKFLNKISDYMAQFGAARALVGLGQFINQFSSGMSNTIVNAGEYIRPSDFTKDTFEFIANSGRSIANVGGDEILVAMGEVDKSIERANLDSKYRVDQTLLKFIAKENMRLFNVLVAYPDAVARKLAWMAYYRKSMVEQGLLGFTESVDTTKPVNDKAADYAQLMVDRNMDSTDAALRGSLFRNRNSAVKILRSIFMPFSSFGLNQKNRMWNDLNALASGKDVITSTRSLASIAGELVVYNAIRYYIAKAILGATLSLLGYDDDDQEELYNKLLNNAKLSSFSKLFTDIVSPMPMLDNQTLKLANKALKGSSLFQADPEAVDKYVEKLKAKGNLTDEEIEAKKKAFEEKNSRSFYIDTEANIGTLGIQYEKAIELLDLVNAWRTGEYTDDYNNERFLTKDSREKLTAPLMMKFFATVYGTRELDQVANKSFKLVKDAESLSKTQKENYDGVKKELGRDLTEFETAIVKKKRTIDTGISEIKYLESKGKFTKQQGSEYLKLLDVFPSPSDEMIIDIQNGKKAADIIKKNKV